MIVRIYTGHDGQTHFEDLPLPAEESHNVALQAGANLVFRCFPADYWSDWHTVPRRQYIFGMSRGGAGWLPGTMTHPATPGRFGHTRGDCVCQSVNV